MNRMRFWHIVKIGFGLAVVALIFILIQSGYKFEWTGFGDFTPPKPDYQRAKTFWDWMQLIVVPLTLFAIAQYFSNREKKRTEQQQEDERTQLVQNREDDILQSYLDRMQALILDKDLLSSTADKATENFARILTLFTLERLSANPKTTLLQFLDEAGLIQSKEHGKPIISLVGADLDRVGQPIGLLSANFEGADLSSSSFQDAKLDLPNFTRANMQNCVLEGASLVYGDFRGANLYIALLAGANLYEAKFDQTTILPNGQYWSDTDMTIFKAILVPPLTDAEQREVEKELHIK